ncbi:unnamed protein product [Spirodela intermedia]|uniref:Glycosyltransferase n=1 Tax=Spirodela intermedia TaxID=51605 RepID=A0A7I8KY83_SPIIN|nr:unnamed protein product [Spirodela intermedia]
MDAADAGGDGGVPHLVFLPTPGMGHLIPLAEFAKRLVLHHRITATFITGDVFSKSQMALLDRLPRGIENVVLPDVSLDDIPSNAKAETVISVCAVRALPAVRGVLGELKKTTNLVALVSDLFGGFALEVAREFGIRPYIFFTTTGMSLSLFLRLPELDAQTSGEYRDLPDLIRLPGCIPLHGSDLLNPIQDRKNEAYTWLLRQSSRYRLAAGIFLNSFEGLEGGAIRALTADPGNPTIYPVGPIVRNGGEESDRDSSGCVAWLDEQPRGSVLFVSFGSGGTLPLEQLTELALGLEASGERFLWVVRSPREKRADSAFFSVHSSNDPFAFLPEGFVERTKRLGLVVSSWAPQVKILRHESTGGFLTHCGWNSSLESVVHGVPMIAWPLYAEQKMNAVLLVEDVKVALRPRAGEDGIVGRGEVAQVVKSLMEGEDGKRLRERLREVQEEGARGLTEGGASYRAIAAAADEWKRACSPAP